MKNYFVLFLWMLTGMTAWGQNYTGVIKDASTNTPLAYVNIGLVGKNVGTVSDGNGLYALTVDDTLYDNDTIGFSYIGYAPVYMKFADYRQLATKDISLSPQVVQLGEVVVRPMKTEDKVLGNTFTNKTMQGGFGENNKGYECGVLLKIKKRAVLEELTCNITQCAYDSVFYRLNVYREEKSGSFVNILHEPIYIQRQMDKKAGPFIIDLTSYNLIVEGNTLVTLEHITDLGEGHLFFSAGMLGSTCYFRKTSLGEWSKIPIKIAFSVKAKVEK